MIRFRERGGFGQKTTTIKWWYVANGTETTTSGPYVSSNPSGNGVHESMTDTVTPNFRKRVESGEIINNPMNKVTVRSYGADNGWLFSKTIGNAVYYGEASGEFVGVSYGTPQHLNGYPNLDGLKTEVATQVWARVLQPTASLLVTAGEMGKTLRMLRRPLAPLVNLVKQGIQRGLKSSGRRGDPSAVVQAFANTWLESRYGWRPLMMEVDNALEALSQTANERYTARASRSIENTYTSSSVGKNGGISIPFTTETKVKARVSAGVIYQHEIPLTDYIWGTRLSDIPVAAWDLVPYSFVIDWFVNVNTFLQAIVPKGEVKYLCTWIKEDVVQSTLRTSGAATFADWTTLRSPSATATLITETVRRSPGIPPPGLVLKSSALASIFSDLRGVDSLALLIQRLR